MTRWQVFGLMGVSSSTSPTSPLPGAEAQCLIAVVPDGMASMVISFPFTAAGQFRSFTGFPFTAGPTHDLDETTTFPAPAQTSL